VRPTASKWRGSAHRSTRRALNSLELIWGNLKCKELANLFPDTIDEAADYADQGLDCMGSDTDLSFAFLRHRGFKL
jgi:hypothetical protein